MRASASTSTRRSPCMMSNACARSASSLSRASSWSGTLAIAILNPHHRALHLGGRAGEEAPQIVAGAIGLAVATQLLGGVALGVHADGEQAHAAVGIEPVLQRAHPLGEPRAGIGAAGEDEVRHPDLPAQIVASEGAPALVGEG